MDDHSQQFSRTPPTGGVVAIAYTLAAPALIIALWSALSLIVDDPIIPPPWGVLQRAAELGWTGLAPHIGASLGRVVVALTAATVLALPTGIAIGRIRWARRLFTPVIYLLYPIPKIALLPVVFLLVGVGEGARVLLVWLVLFFQVLVAVRDAVVALPDGYRVSIRLLGGGRSAYLRFVLLPAILPSLLTSLRIGSGTALAVLFFAETFFTDRGLGVFIVDSWMKASYLDMTVGIVVIGLVGVLLFSLLDGAQRIFCHWTRYS